MMKEASSVIFWKNVSSSKYGTLYYSWYKKRLQSEKAQFYVIHFLQFCDGFVLDIEFGFPNQIVLVRYRIQFVSCIKFYFDIEFDFNIEFDSIIESLFYIELFFNIEFLFDVEFLLDIEFDFDLDVKSDFVDLLRFQK